MHPSDFQRFSAVMTGMAELYQRELSTFLLDAYWLALRDWTLADFEDAAAHLMKNSKWLPKPSEFTDLRKAGEAGPAEAWSEALRACVQWRNPERLPTGLIAAAARAVGGFRMIAMSDTERDLPHLQRRFMAAYEELRESKAIRDSVPEIAFSNSNQPRIGRRGFAQIGAITPEDSDA